MSDKQEFVIENGVLKEYTGHSGRAVLPEEVTAIGKDAFKDCDQLTELVLQKRLDFIEEGAFDGCVNLKKVTLEENMAAVRGNIVGSVLTGWEYANGRADFSRYAAKGDEYGWELQFQNNAALQIRGGALCTQDGELLCPLVRVHGGCSVPEGITEIGRWAYHGCSELTGVTLPEGVAKIGESAFQDCTALRQITLPESLTEVGPDAFRRCAALTGAALPDHVAKIGAGAFRDCTGLASVALPKELEELGHCTSQLSLDEGVFSGCTSLTSVVIPEGTRTIGEACFYNCKKLSHVELPLSLRRIGKRALETTAVQQVDNSVPLMMAGCKIGVHELGDCFWSPDNLESAAAVYLTQAGRAAARAEEKLIDHMPQTIQVLEKLLLQYGDAARYEKAVKFLVNQYEVQKHPEQVQSLYAAAQKCGAKKAAALLETLMPQENAGGAGQDPFAFLRKELQFQEGALRTKYKARKGTEQALKLVKLRDSQETAPAYGVLCAIVPYEDQYAFRPGYADNKHDFTAVRVHPMADQAAELLDRASLLEALKVLIARHDAWLIPYCRYGSGKDISDVAAKLNVWARQGASGRGAALTARGALMLSQTREAMLQLEKDGCLEKYAKLWHTDAEVLRDTAMVDFGLDAQGKKTYDLGGGAVTLSIGPDLVPVLYDETARKTVKSLPKRGADPEKYQAAGKDLSELKKNLKKVVKSRCGKLFQDFLNGTVWVAERWKEVCCGNPLLRQTASLLVWDQGGTCFTLSQTGEPVDAGGQPYAVGKGKIKLAHPMEMRPEEVTAWQKYFTSHGLKQSFAQIWEPAVDFDAIKPDRYKGAKVPAYRFKDQEKHGISFDFAIGPSELYIGLNGCELTFDGGTAVERHYLNLTGELVLDEFKVQTRNRRSNHIVALLDQWTVYGRVANDDASVVKSLDSFTLAQVTEILNFAIENQRVNCTAALLEYKNKKFPDFDPMEIFTLE